MRGGLVLRSLLLACWSAGPALALSGADGFLVIPTAPVLPHQSYQIEAVTGYHMSMHNGVLADRHPYVSGFRLGLFNQFELGMQYGEKISLDAKVRLREEDGLLPVVTLGMRQIAASQEAYFYSVPSGQQQSYAGEFFLSSSLGNDWFRGHAGLSILSALDSNKACPFWGLQQQFGLGASTWYEGFFREGRTHHNIALQWDIAKILRLTAGATEFHRYIFQNGEFGFHTKSLDDTENGYRAPGIFASITLTGFMKKESWPNTRADLEEARKRLASQEEQLRGLQARMDEFELTYLETQGSQGDSLSRRTARTEALFDSIVQGYQEEVWDIADLRARQSAFLALQGPAQSLLLRTAQSPIAPVQNRATAIRVMGFSKLALFTAPLARLLREDSDPALRRESALALGLIATPDARKALAEAQPGLPDELRATVDQILKTFAP